MKNKSNNQSKPVDPRHYTEKYYLEFGNYPCFLKTKGTKLFPVHKRIVATAKIKPGMKILDLGCGRGELLVAAARLGAEACGIDYSKAAIELAQKSILLLPRNLRTNVKIIRRDIKKLSLTSNYYDRIIMGELIEHLRPWELNVLLSKVKKALKKNGRLIIHTWPNKLVLDYGYTIFNLWQYIRAKPMIGPKRGKYDPVMHVNEQTEAKLKKSLSKNGYSSKVWLEKDYFYCDLESLVAKKRGVKKIIIKMLARQPFRTLFFNHIYAIAWKK